MTFKDSVFHGDRDNRDNWSDGVPWVVLDRFGVRLAVYLDSLLIFICR